MKSIFVVCALLDEAKQFLDVMKKSSTTHPSAMSIIQTGLGTERVVAKLHNVCTAPPHAILVAGTAAGINQDYRPGDIVIYSKVIDHRGEVLDMTTELTETLTTTLAELQPKSGVGYTSLNAITTFSEKASLRSRFDADCIDMETAAIVEFANQRSIPVAAMRVVVDPFDQAIPAAALAGLKQDGSTNAFGTISALIKAPQQLPEILRIAQQYNQAMKSLARAAKLLVANLSCGTSSHSATN